MLLQANKNRFMDLQIIFFHAYVQLEFRFTRFLAQNRVQELNSYPALC